MTKNTQIQPTALPAWQFWAAAFAGASLAFIVAAVTGIGEGKVIFDDGQKFGYSMGWGLAVGLLMWMIFYFPVFKKVTVSKRIIAYVVIMLGGTIGVMGNL